MNQRPPYNSDRTVAVTGRRFTSRLEIECKEWVLNITQSPPKVPFRNNNYLILLGVPNSKARKERGHGRNKESCNKNVTSNYICIQR